MPRVVTKAGGGTKALPGNVRSAEDVIEYNNKHPPSRVGVRSRNIKCIFYKSNIDGNIIFVMIGTISPIPILETKITKKDTLMT